MAAFPLVPADDHRLPEQMELVVLAPEGTATVRIGDRAFPVENRIALVEVDGPYSETPDVVARAADGEVVGSTTLAMPPAWRDDGIGPWSLLAPADDLE